MFSIQTNSAAMAALQALEATQASLGQTQNQVSTGFAVNSAADNAGYFTIATQLRADSSVVGAANAALSQSEAVLQTATSAINSVLTTISSIQSTLTQATNPTANIADINTTLASLGAQLNDAVNGASFNGLNLLDGSQETAGNTSLNFVAGFNATPSGGSFNTISLALQQLIGTGGILTTGATGNASGTIVDATQLGGSGTGALQVTNNATAGAGQVTASDALNAVNAIQASLSTYAATIGTAASRMQNAQTLNTALQSNYQNGVSALVDADMNVASTRLQALQTQEQLGIQSLSIANQSAQLVLKLFP